MSQKLNRLRNRMRIEKERSEKEQAQLKSKEWSLDVLSRRLEKERKNLDKSVALRIKVDRDFRMGSQIGPAFAIQTVFYPEEFQYQFLSKGGNSARDITYFAGMKGRDVGEQISKVIVDCVTNGLDSYKDVK